jgi:hypothetical protein
VERGKGGERREVRVKISEYWREVREERGESGKN